jgi:hypothetical protein
MFSHVTLLAYSFPAAAALFPAFPNLKQLEMKRTRSDPDESFAFGLSDVLKSLRLDSLSIGLAMTDYDELEDGIAYPSWLTTPWACADTLTALDWRPTAFTEDDYAFIQLFSSSLKHLTLGALPDWHALDGVRLASTGLPFTKSFSRLQSLSVLGLAMEHDDDIDRAHNL